ncbi:MAG TPA: PilZ domain-containing protein [Candidatus Acidoferrales bacterium]|nr:PilZ domain-containing protein [Candidatus Acidoferrales bacterium]
MASNRRLFYRHPMKLPITLRVSGMRAPVPATLVDLSGGGGMVLARSMLKNDIPVEFDLPRHGRPHLRLPGKIRKVTYAPGVRTFKYAVEFDTLDDDTRESLLRFISEEQRRTISVSRLGFEAANLRTAARGQEQRAHRRIEIDVPVRIWIVDSPTILEATAIDLSTGGMRIMIDQVLRQEWVVTLRFTLPVDMLLRRRSAKTETIEPFPEIKVSARALPGIKQWRGKYVQTLTWTNPDPLMTHEISRFVQAAHRAAR